MKFLFVRPVYRRLAFVLPAMALVTCGARLSGATVRVDVGDNFFRPAITNITVGDSVRWVWIGLSQHSSTHTGTPVLWDSGLRANGATFTNTFNTVGSFPYRCTVPLHTGQNGTINVAAVDTNPAPTVAMIFPTNGTVYAAPATVRLSATASDSNGVVTSVQFMRSAVSLGNDATAPYEFVDENVSAGTFSYSAVATDDGGDRTTNRVTVTVVNPNPIQLSNAERLSPTQFRFSYSGNFGLRYVVEKSADLGTWQPLGTNRGAGAQSTFTDDAATDGQSFYRVGRLPNP
jgi:plastocyanin